MESKLLRGGKNIVDHTNEQQRALEQRRQEIAEQKVSQLLLHCVYRKETKYVVCGDDVLVLVLILFFWIKSSWQYDWALNVLDRACFFVLIFVVSGCMLCLVC